MTPYHFLDESGDPGLISTRGTSSHLVIAIVELEERSPLPVLADVRLKLHLPPDFEFKYHKTTEVQRNVFFDALRPFNWRIWLAAVDKQIAPREWLSAGGEERLVDLTVGLILRAGMSEVVASVLIIDGAKPRHLRTLRKKLSQEFRLRSRQRPYRRIIAAESHREDGIQLADMIAGAARSYVSGTNDHAYKSFASKVRVLWMVNDTE